MKITRVKIKNLFGIKEMELDGSSIEITGSNGVGKTSIIDAIRYALTNDSGREYIIHKGETEGEILIETDTGLQIDRRKRTNQADYKSVKDGRNIVSSPESFLRSLFTELQINPVAFINMPAKEQNRVILDLIDFPWDLNWIKEKFGEIPAGVNYDQNILQVLSDIQADNGHYFTARQDINRDIRNKNAFIAEIAAEIPPKYDAQKWEQFDTGAKYKELTEANRRNGLISRAKAFQDGYESKIRGYQADMEIAVAEHAKAIESERSDLNALVARLTAEIESARDKLTTLDSKLSDKTAVEKSDYEAKVAQLQKDMGVASEYVGLEPIDTAPLQEEVDLAEKMKRYLNEFQRMKLLQAEVEELGALSEQLSDKISLARDLPGIILQTATIPVDGLTVENGIPLIHGLPVSNLSEGEKLDLCIDVALSNPNGIEIILIDGIEKLSEANRERVYQKCKARGVQFIATRTTDDDDLRVATL